MSAVERLTITLSADMAILVRQAVAEGDYASTSEVVRDALRDWDRARESDRRDLERIREAVRVGLDSGPGIAAEEVYATLRALIARRQAAQG